MPFFTWIRIYDFSIFWIRIRLMFIGSTTLIWYIGFSFQLEVEVKKATPRPKSGGGGGSSYGVLDYYGGMDYYYGYNDYNNWYGGGKAHREKSARMNPY